MSIIYHINKECNGIEIKFSEKPSKKVLVMLKEHGFRWHPHKGVWYAKNTEDNLKFAELIKDETTYTQTSLFDTVEEVAEVEQVAEIKAFENNRHTKATKSTKTTKKAEPKKADKKAEKKAEPTQFSFTFDEKKSYTYADCKAKMDEERKTYKEPEHQYVIDGVLKLAEVRLDFVNSLMDEDKNYTKAFEYVSKEARKLAKNGYACLSADKVLGMVLDYYGA